MKLSDLALALGISERTAYRWVKCLELPYKTVINHKIGGVHKQFIESGYVFESIQLSKELDMKPVYTIKELAKKLGKDYDTVHKMIINESNIPVRRIGVKPIIFLSDLHARLSSDRKTSTH